ncbi:MAG TPA: hypothetical protein V6C81_25795 [Planktothrix sp.]|jgi:hypothetical protein
MATKPLIKKTIDELQIDCEVAAEVLAETLAFCAKELAQEKAVESPNQEKIETLERQVLELKRDKLSIGIDNTEVINKALYFYAPLLKKRTAVNGQQLSAGTC